ncbi:MAG: PAS domain-containing protein [Candidatus Melainabacteria bacterium]|nr:PAS domain-containing protein [Candidatus Melainabacteria bacterium]
MIDIPPPPDFLENAPIALLQTDSRGAILRFNQAALELLQTRAISKEQTLSQYFSSESQSLQAFAQLKSAGILKEFAAILKTPNGNLRHVIIDANVSLNSQREPHQYNFFIRDVTTSWLKQSQASAQFDITKVLIGATAIVDALEQICTTLCTLLSFEIGIVWRIDQRANRMSRLVHKIISDQDKHEYLIARSVNVPLSVAAGFPSTIWFNGKGKVYTDLEQYDTCFNEPASRIRKTYPAVVAFPICIGNRIWGVISLLSTRATPISSELVTTLESIGYQIGHFVDRIEANEAYLKSQERYYVAITGSNDGIWDWDLVTNEVFYSPRYKSQLGFEENELANHFDTFRTLCHPDDYQQVLAKVQRHIDTRQPYEAEMRCRTKSGDYKWICARGQAIWNAQGRAIRMAGSHRDISELKAAEQARHEYEQRLLDSESMFRQLAENIREVFWIISASTDDFIYASPAFEELWLEQCDQLYKNKEVFFNPIVEEDRPRVRKTLQGLIVDADIQNPGGQGFDLEFRIETKEKEIRWIWSRLFPVLDKTGRCDRLYGIAHDITEKKEVERRVSEFYSTVSHELRTPLTSIRAALGLIEGGLTGEISAETMEYVSIARSNSDRLIRLINDILDIRRLEANKLEMKIEHIRPSDLIETTIDSIRAFAEERGVTISFNLESNGRNIVGDRDRLVQVLTNLISNAIKYTPRGKAVRICCTSSGDNVKINVIDQGPGIAEEHMQGLFGLFQQLSCVENEFNTGSGLGLAISKAIVDKLGGSIGAESTFGEGATFWFEVPALEAPKTLETLETPENIESLREQGEAEPASILLMEDSDSIALILKTLITRTGYHCARAANIAEAHTLAETQRPDLLFADINLPDGNGLDFVNWLHEHYSAEAIPVIVLSGAETNIDRVHRPELVDWVKKPFETEEILRLMKLRTKKLPQLLDGSTKRN